MNLYEVTNGWIGESYVRVYVWAADEKTALELARAAYRNYKGLGNDPSYSEDLRIERLFSAADAPFATQPSDGGWKHA